MRKRQISASVTSWCLSRWNSESSRRVQGTIQVSRTAELVKRAFVGRLPAPRVRGELTAKESGTRLEAGSRLT